MRKMKDSGQAWIGKIPESWTLIPGKHLFKQRTTRGNGESLVLLSPTQSYGVIPQDLYEQYSGMNAVKLKEDANLNSLKTVKKGDFCISLRSFQGGFEYSRYEGVVSPAYQVFYQTKALCDDFYKYLFKSSSFIEKINSFTMSLRDGKNISFQDFGNMLLPVPPILEQQQIADYLDSQCTKIDSIAEKIQSEIDILQQCRKSVIYKAVTKGLDPNVEMKDSGERWIGKIPSHWKINRVASLYSERNESGDPDLPVLMVSINSGVSKGEVSNEDRMRSVVQSEDKTKYKRVYPDDLVYNMMRAWQGAFGAVRVDGLVSPAYVVAQPRQQLDTRYIEALFRTPAAVAEMKRFSYGIADFRLRLYWQYFRNIRLCFPPLEEQKKIADFVEERSIKINAVIAKKQEQLSILADYKKSLIYEFVTGKKEVPAS